MNNDKMKKAKEILSGLGPEYKGVLVRFVDDKFDNYIPLTDTEEDEVFERTFAATSALLLGRGHKVEFRRVHREKLKEVV